MRHRRFTGAKIPLILAFLVHGMGKTGIAENLKAAADHWDEAPRFWSFQAPERKPCPAVRRTGWPRTRLDYFILAPMEARGLSPSPEADRRTIFRRLYYDLSGLPPAAEDTEAFMADRRPNAYREWVERLLDSPRFGERWASMWLTVARYAEDQAHQVGNDTKHFYPNAYRYRAWVIRAFNQDLPYDRFIRLQLAADQMPSARRSDLPALGFLGLGPKYYNRGRLDVMADEWEDRIDTVSRSFLGLTVACARCHDHKYDPITMEDYYGLAGVFASTKMVNLPFDKRPEAMTKEDKKKHRYTIHVVQDGDPRNLHVFLRGNVESPGPLVARRFLRILSSGPPKAFTRGSGRAELAEAIADPKNPLTARVMVNRVWMTVFGQGLVVTPSNFGHLGARPTHPDLLDDLAVRFIQSGWSIKRLVREMVLSSTYRQSSSNRSSPASIDPANRYYWRMSRRRMPVEMWRDTLLATAGNLDQAGGKSLKLSDPVNHRRTVYARISRLSLNDLLMQFDYPDPNVHSAKRAVTITPLQKLYALNSPFMLEQAASLLARVVQENLATNKRRIESVYRLLAGRSPSAEEQRLGLEFLRREAPAEGDRWAMYVQALLATNEMMYVD